MHEEKLEEERVAALLAEKERRAKLRAERERLEAEERARLEKEVERERAAGVLPRGMAGGGCGCASLSSHPHMHAPPLAVRVALCARRLGGARRSNQRGTNHEFDRGIMANRFCVELFPPLPRLLIAQTS